MAVINLKYLYRQLEPWWALLLPEFSVTYFNLEEDWSDHSIVLTVRVNGGMGAVAGFNHKIPYNLFVQSRNLETFLYREVETVAHTIRNYFLFGGPPKIPERSVRLIRFRKGRNERSC